MLIFQLLATTPCASFFPSILFFILGVTGRFGPDAEFSTRIGVMLWACLLAVILRASIVAATFAHEWAHAFMALCFGHVRCVTEPGNWRCNVPLSAWAICLCPFLPWPEEACASCFRVPSVVNCSESIVIRRFGALFSCAIALASAPLMWTSELHYAAVIGTWVVAAGAVVSDFFQFEQSSTVYCCGNFGMMLIKSAEMASVDIYKTLRRMAGNTAARGGQSGGVVTLLPDGTAHRCRYVPSKREDLAKSLIRDLQWGLWWRRILGFFKSIFCFCSGTRTSKSNGRNECVFFAGHTRFATSSAPTKQESHPHRFGDQRTVKVWIKQGGMWASSVEPFEIFVTHNGDFDFWTIMGGLHTQSDVAVWLRRVLHIDNALASCDSVKIGGVMELLRTKGMWLASLRLAYQIIAQPDFNKTCDEEPHLVKPSRQSLEKAAAIADRVFANFVKDQPTLDAEGQRTLATNIKAALKAEKSELAIECIKVSLMVSSPSRLMPWHLSLLLPVLSELWDSEKPRLRSHDKLVATCEGIVYLNHL